MASNIQIETDLKEYAPAYNNLDVVIREHDATTRNYPNFKYIFDLYIDGVIGFTRFLVAPEPLTGNYYGSKDFGNILESYVNSYILKDYSLLTGGFQYMDGGIRKYHIEYGNEYSLTSTDPIIQYPSLVVGSDKYVWNASLPFNEWVDFDFSDIDISGLSGKWLTTQKTKEISITDVGYSGVIASSDTDIEYLEVTTYDSTGLAIGYYQIQNLGSTGVYPAKYMSVSTGPMNLNNITVGLVIGTQPIIDSSVHSYRCVILDSTPTTVSEGITFIMKEPCGYTERRLHFQNKWGAFDAFNFNLVSKETVNIEKKSLKYNPNRVNASGEINYSVSDRTNINYHIKSTNQIQLNADYITEEESIWLEELFTSPEIYLESKYNNGKEKRDLIAVSEIQSKKYQIKTDRVDNLFNIDLVITLSNDNYRQRR